MIKTVCLEDNSGTCDKNREYTLVPNLINVKLKTEHVFGYVYDMCNIFEALDFIAFGTKPVEYPNKFTYFMCCSTCSLRQALEYIGLTQIPTDASGEKFNCYDKRYMSDMACEQMKKIEQAIAKLEVLIDEKLVKPILIKNGKRITIDITQPVIINKAPQAKSFFTITCNDQQYDDAEFEFAELEKNYKEYSKPQIMYKLILQDRDLFIQSNTETPKLIHHFNHRPSNKQSKTLDILKIIMKEPNKKFKLGDKIFSEFGSSFTFHKLFSHMQSNPKTSAIMRAFFKIGEKEIVFKGDTHRLELFEQL